MAIGVLLMVLSGVVIGTRFSLSATALAALATGMFTACVILSGGDMGRCIGLGSIAIIALQFGYFAALILASHREIGNGSRQT